MEEENMSEILDRDVGWFEYGFEGERFYNMQFGMEVTNENEKRRKWTGKIDREGVKDGKSTLEKSNGARFQISQRLRDGKGTLAQILHHRYYFLYLCLNIIQPRKSNVGFNLTSNCIYGFKFNP